MTLSDFDYILPDDKIAQTPMSPRDHSKLLILDRKPETLTDAHFYDLADLLTPNDVLVVNDTKVFPARLNARSAFVGPARSFEILLEKEISLTADTVTWSALTKPGLKVGQRISVPNTPITGTCIRVDDYRRIITFSASREHFMTILTTWAKTPIPPYIKWQQDDEARLRALYQTVYAHRVGAMAAPTAGLHFTPELLTKLRTKGVQIINVTLHVGLGTFLPVKTENVLEHHMHEEWYEVSYESSVALQNARKIGKRIIAVGTTVVRVLETSKFEMGSGTTSIFIYPPYKFDYVDSLITNFHTPKSTLLMLVTAFCGGTIFKGSLIGKAYQHALDNDYHFYSFGDAMWIR
ncbi:MAG TPA: tRNA preQ1(34) S-adenosylmethionine ribosyltransferase-isomerase QueA [Patescibacteria group bacterium]|nr:tRNA preQ1(34) S-adenosylmethionine ribosyltransferase-isomerase QueA [Patescibacteria group bacterium]